MKTFEIIILVIFIFYWVVAGILSANLQEEKGYRGGFWIAFLFGIIGLIYSAGLPDKSQRMIVKKDGEQIIQAVSNDEDNDDISNDFVSCKNCGFPVGSDEDKCSYCGAEKKQK